MNYCILSKNLIDKIKLRAYEELSIHENGTLNHNIEDSTITCWLENDKIKSKKVFIARL